MKQIIATSTEHAEFENKIKFNCEKVKEVLKEFTKMDMPFKIRTQEDFLSLCQNPEIFIKARLEKAIEEPAPIFGFRVNKKKAVELLDLPNLEKLVELCNAVNPSLTAYLSFSTNAVKLMPETLEKIKEDYSVVITNDAQSEFHQVHKDLQSALTAFNEQLVILRGYGIPAPRLREALYDYFIITENEIKIKDKFYFDNRGVFKKFGDVAQSPLDQANNGLQW